MSTREEDYAVAAAELAAIKAAHADLASRVQKILDHLARIKKDYPPPPPPLLAFVHIPKTAGGTVKSMLTGAYSSAAIRDTGNYMSFPRGTLAKVIQEGSGWDAWLRKGGRVTIGHVPYGIYREHLPANTRYMTFLREPVDRVLSHYYRHRAKKEARREQDGRLSAVGKITTSSLEEALADPPLPQLSNLATRFLCGHPDPFGELPTSALDDAKANLREFAFVGIQERFEESLVLLKRMLDLDDAEYQNVHVSLDRPAAEEIAEEQRALIEEHNRLDSELYAFGRRLFDDAVAAWQTSPSSPAGSKRRSSP